MKIVYTLYPYIRLSTDNKDLTSLNSYSINETTYYYLKTLADFSKNLKSKISWNWSAALFGFLWMAYRRMYFFTILYILLIDFVFDFIPTSINLLSKNPLPIEFYTYKFYFEYILMFFLNGLFANRLYFHFIHQKLKRNVIPNSGVNIMALIIFLILTIVQKLLPYIPLSMEFLTKFYTYKMFIFNTLLLIFAGVYVFKLYKPKKHIY